MAGRHPNIVIVAIDSLRADHLGCYGYDRPTSPMIDALARESIVFDSAFAAGIPTMPSFTTMYTGLHPYRHGIVNHVGNRRLSDRLLLLPQLAKECGYMTAACDNLVVQGEGRGSWFARGYDHYSGFLYRPFNEQSADLTRRAIGFLDEHARNRSQPLFMFIHYWDPHTPYAPPPPYDTLHYEPGSGPVDLAEVRRLAPEYYDMFIGDMKLRYPDDYAYIVAQYDGEISRVDAQVGQLIETLNARDYWDDTILVLLADHGECFGEGEFYFDHHGLYDAVTRMALMVRVPGQRARRISALASNEDLLPTLAELAGLPLPPYALTGTSLVPALDCETRVRSRVISAESSRQASLALRTDRWKLIVPIVKDAGGRPLPDFYGRPRSDTPLLFDLAADPGERHDLSAELPGQRAEMQRALADWRDETARITQEPDPIMAQGLSLGYDIFMERLFGRR